VKTVRRRMRSRLYVPQKEALRLATEATKGLVCIHKCGIIQGDVGCHNMLLDSRGTLKVADFAGSSVRNCQISASVDYEVGSKLPDDPEPTIRSDIFALGSAIYEMLTRKVPYMGRPYTEVQRLFKEGQFPDDFPKDFDAAVGLRTIIEKCWGKGGVAYASAEEVLTALNALSPKGSSPSTTSRRRSSLKTGHSTKSSSSGKEIVLSSSISSPKEKTKSYVNPHKDQRPSRKNQGQHRNSEIHSKRRHHRHNPSETTLTHFAQSLRIFLVGKPRYLES